MKKTLRVILWILAPFAIIFIGIVVYSLFHLDEARLNAQVGKSSTSLYVTNTDKIDWVECVATLNGDKFTSPTFNVLTGARYQIPFSAFTTEDGMQFDLMRYAPKVVRVECGPRGERRYDDVRWNE